MLRTTNDRDFQSFARQQLNQMRSEGTFRVDRVLISPQGPVVTVSPGAEVLNFCSNNYLGLANHADTIAAAHEALDRWGFGLSAGRVVCGTQQIHRELEQELSRFLGTEDTLLYASCFDANGGLFEPLFDENDAIISDTLNHASIIDGIRLSKARRFRYATNDMVDLERRLEEASDARFILIATDGVFSMDGTVAHLKRLCDLADQTSALVMVDDSHGVGILGANGRGSHEACGVEGRVDLLTGTLGKALGGASGGYVSGRGDMIELLRQRSRSFIFTNSVPPVIVATSLAVLRLGDGLAALRARLLANTERFRREIVRLGFDVIPGQHPIVPVMIRDATAAREMASRLFSHGIFVTALSYPIVPRGTDRIRVQISAAHEPQHIDQALEAFALVGRELRTI